MSRQSPSQPTPHRGWLIGLGALLLAVGTGAAGAALVSRTGQPSESAPTAHPAQSSPAQTVDPLATSSGSVPTASPGKTTPRAQPSRPALAGGQPDPGAWSNKRLATVMVMTGAKMGDAVAIQAAARRGVAGVVIFGPSSPNLAQTLRRARAVAPADNLPLIASDEEGGAVQRLSPLIYPLPSAEVMGRWGPARITSTAHRYALRMRSLGVNVALGPDADLAVPGFYIATAHRSFSADPRGVAVAVDAWNNGLRAAGILGVVKHWPGHGQATDTHVGGSVVPAWSVLRDRDLIPFEAAFAHHAPAVMVGHLRVPGLTEGALPASESRAALRALRAQAGPTTLIVTDDLSMAAASSTLRITPAQAAVQSLVAGADVAMVCWAPLGEVTSAVTRAIDDGRLPRSQAVASARRVLHTKAQVAAPR